MLDLTSVLVLSFFRLEAVNAWLKEKAGGCTAKEALRQMPPQLLEA